MTDDRRDNWYNALTALGKQGFDKNQNTYYRQSLCLDTQELLSIYAEEGIGSRIVNRPAADSVRRWFNITNDTDGKIQDILSSVSTQAKVQEAIQWSRLFGGAIIIMLTDDGGELAEPININRVTKIRNLKIFSKPSILIDYESIDTDPNSITFEEPTMFTINTRHGGEFQVHRSRCLVFKGYQMPNIAEQFDRSVMSDWDDWYWGISHLYKVYHHLRDLTSAMQGMSSVMQEFVTTIYKIKNLGQIMLQGNKQVLYDRMDIIHTSKSNLNAVFMDADGDDYQRNSADVSGVDKIIEMLILLLTGSSGMPVTLLMGRSPAGLSATGESDIRFYYDDVSGYQHGSLQLSIMPLINLAGKISKIMEPVIEWNPLWEPTEQEQAETRKTVAETDKIYIDTQVLGPEMVQKMRFHGEYSTDMFIPEEDIIDMFIPEEDISDA